MSKQDILWQLYRSSDGYHATRIDGNVRQELIVSPSREATLAAMRLFEADNIHDWSSGDNWSSKTRTLDEVPIVEDTSKLPKWIVAEPTQTKRRVCIFIEENALELLDDCCYIK